MAYRILQMTALTAALLVGGAMAAGAAPDDEIKYRDGKPVGQTEMKGDAMAGDKPMAAETSKPAKKTMKRSSSKKMSMKKTSMKRKPSVKRLRGHSENPSSRM